MSFEGLLRILEKVLNKHGISNDNVEARFKFYTLSMKELSCDTISTLFFRASYRFLALHGFHERALDVALDDRFSSRRKLLDTLHITCLYLRLGDTAKARSLIGHAMVARDVVIDSIEAADFRGLSRTSTLGLILGRHLGLPVDTNKIAEFRSLIPHQATTEFDMIAEDLDLFVAAFVPDKNIDFGR